MTTRREQVRNNAKYLREVRPLDPEEIAEYVEGQPHPGVVRQLLREEAVDLEIRERPDGTFVPVGDEPLSVHVDRVDRLPEYAERTLENLLVDAYGPGWPDGDSGDELRDRIRNVKARYFHGTAVEYDETTALAYAVYHLPATYATACYVLADLASDDLLPRTLRVLDVGAGVGGPALAVAELLADAGLVDYTAVEPSAAADVLEALFDRTGPNLHASVHRETAEAFDPGGPYDLILCSNVLSELADPAAVVGRYLDALATDGTLAAVAPADRETATGLRRIERRVEAEYGATVYAPTVRLWPGYAPDSTSWSFDVKADLAVPAFQSRLDEGERASTDQDDAAGTGEFVNVDVQYAFSYLRRDDARRIDFTPDAGRVARMADMETHVTERIDCVGVKLSHDLSTDPNANPLFLVGDGSQTVDHFAVRTDASTLNAPLVEADYGEFLFFEGALVLWNEDEGAYNLVVDGECVVDRQRP